MGMDGHQERARDQAYDAIIARTFPFRRDLKRTETDGCRRAGRARAGLSCRRAIPVSSGAIADLSAPPAYDVADATAARTRSPTMQGMTERLEAMLAKGTDNMLLRFAGQGLRRAGLLRRRRKASARGAGIRSRLFGGLEVAGHLPGAGRQGRARGLGVRPGSSAGARRPAGGEGTAGLHEAAGQASQTGPPNASSSVAPARASCRVWLR